ncbi:hypothetical protein DDI_3438 [Dickeya dianthicola RNS04.9]|nr:hypothetical protein DDI_3438 [Dickeya dianthicola RNS04.9]
MGLAVLGFYKAIQYAIDGLPWITVLRRPLCDRDTALMQLLLNLVWSLLHGLAS